MKKLEFKLEDKSSPKILENNEQDAPQIASLKFST